MVASGPGRDGSTIALVPGRDVINPGGVGLLTPDKMMQHSGIIEVRGLFIRRLIATSEGLVYTIYNE